VKRARLLIVVFGIFVPYLARIPGVFFKGTEWLTSFFGDPPIGAFLFFGAFNAVCWGSILFGSFSYKNPKSILFPAIFGFAFPAIAYACLDLSSSSTAAVALVFIPIYSFPLVFLGWLIGRWYDRKVSKQIQSLSQNS
jgi:hypothetical protein